MKAQNRPLRSMKFAFLPASVLTFCVLNDVPKSSSKVQRLQLLWVTRTMVTFEQKVCAFNKLGVKGEILIIQG